MTSSEIIETKEKILLTAKELFGRYGFDGTSIREISKKSRVNLAAINYHFKSKDCLFWEVMAHTYTHVDNKIAEHFSTSPSTVALALKTFDYFLEESLSLKGAMKMMLDESVKPTQSDEVRGVLEKQVGPPGGFYFAQAIQREVGYRLNREGAAWGVKAVFGSVFHWAVMLSSEKVCSHQSEPLFSPAQMRKDVEKMVEAHLHYLKSHPEHFEERAH